MSMARKNLFIVKGQDFSLPPITIEIDDVLLDLSGASVYAQIRESQDRNAALIVDFTCKVDGVEVTNPATTDNEIVLSLTDAQTAAIDKTQTSGWYDLMIVDSAGVDTYYLCGAVQFQNTATVKP